MSTSSTIDPRDQEFILDTHIFSVCAELGFKMRKQPTQNRFSISAGCVSDEIGIKIAEQLTQSGMSATYVSGGYNHSPYIDVEVKR